MLQFVIKRSGDIEPFIPHKLNRWGEWASDTLGERVNWSSTVLDAVKGLTDTIHTQELQKHLINACLLKKNWPYNVMAGRLYSALIRKELYGDNVPTVKELHKKLVELGYMRKLAYSDNDYRTIETYIKHDRDFNYAHFQIQQIYKKYSIQNRTTRHSFETPQFTFMRMAMDLAEDESPNRLVHVLNFYEHLSQGRINAPTPNYVNLGTSHRGYASCCLYTTNDTARSLAIGDHIAYTMTYTGAGIGSHINTRSLGDPVRNGLLVHQGKMPYYKALAGAIKANLQAGRGGACTSYYSCFDPEALVITMLQNPMTPKDKQNRDLHFAVLMNRLFAKKVAKNEDIFTFNIKTAPDLTAAFYSGDQDNFEAIYAHYENNEKFVKNYVSARKLALSFGQQSFDVGTLYYAFIDEINRHTAFKEPIYSSNLCAEITEPTKPYTSMLDLYSEHDHERGEVALCNLAGLNICAINSDEEYASAMYYALKMIDKTIFKAEYKLPHIGYTAKQRLNAGVGIIGLAYYLAKKKLKYSEQAGLDEIHRVAERHCYHAISQSLKLGQELGNAPWMHKTKWPEGWLPIDTYKKTVDELTNPGYNYDWEALRQAIIANGGIRNSCLIAYMPTESSSKASSVPNGIYPIRDFQIKKTDLKNTVSWCAPDDDLLKEHYEIAWRIPSIDLIKAYAVVQKFTDQAISADLYKDRSKNIEITTKEIIEEMLAMVKYGMKTRYYQNSYVVSECHNEVNENAVVAGFESGAVCSLGGCTL